MRIPKFGLFALAGASLISFAGRANAQAAGPYQYFAVPPCRVIDTRNAVGTDGGPGVVGNAAARNFKVQGLCGVPVGAKAASMNVTITAPTTWGNLRLYPTGGAVPLVSTLNFSTGDTVANGAIVPLAATTNDLAVYFDAGVSGQTVQVIIDITGYFL
jgi:hypothetical protein